MKRYIVILFILTVAAASWAKEIKRMAAEKPLTSIAPSAKSYILVSYSSAQGWDIRRVADDSVLKLGGVDVAQSQYSSQSITLLQPASIGGHFIKIKPADNLTSDVTIEIGDNGIESGVSVTTYQSDQQAVQAQIASLQNSLAALQAAIVGGDIPLAPLSAASPTSLDFGAVEVGSTNTLSTTLTNTGQANLVVGSTTISGTNAANFTFAADDCDGATVTPGATCLESIVFTPVAETTSYTAQLNIPHNAEGTPTVVTLSGSKPVDAVVQYAATVGTTSQPVGSLSDRAYFGSRFTTGATPFTLTLVQPKLYRIDGTQPGTLTMEFYSDNAGVPGTLLATSSNSHGSDIVTGTTYSASQYYDFTFPDTSVSATTSYWLILKASAIDSAYYYAWTNGALAGYPMKKSADGSTWVSVSTNQSNVFKVWGY